MEQLFLSIEGKVGEDQCGHFSRQHAEDDAFILDRQIDEHFGDVNGRELGESIAQLVPVFGLDDFFQVGLEDVADHVRDISGWRDCLNW